MRLILVQQYLITLIGQQESRIAAARSAALDIDLQELLVGEPGQAPDQSHIDVAQQAFQPRCAVDTGLPIEIHDPVYEAGPTLPVSVDRSKQISIETIPIIPEILLDLVVKAITISIREQAEELCRPCQGQQSHHCERITAGCAPRRFGGAIIAHGPAAPERIVVKQSDHCIQWTQ